MRPDEPVALREAVAILSALTGREAAALPLSGGAGVTRAEGVALVNRALGRSPDVEAASQWLTPLFDDVPWGHPAYFELMEAAVGHTAAAGAGWTMSASCPRPASTWWARSSITPTRRRSSRCAAAMWARCTSARTGATPAATSCWTDM